MKHWAERYVGKKYVPGEFDCGSLVQLVLRERYDVELALPKPANAVHCQVRQLEGLRDELAAKVQGQPREGDLALMRCGRRLSHCGVLVFINGVAHVLHALRNIRQVVLHRVSDLPRFNCKLISYHRAAGM